MANISQIQTIDGTTYDIKDSGARTLIEEAVPSSRSVTLTTSGWSNKKQTVTVTGVLADETAQLITVTPNAASLSAYTAYGVMATGQAANAITFTCDETPTSSLTVFVTIQEVAYAS